VREPVLTSAGEAVSEIRPGSTIGIGGILNSSHPMAFVREIVRRGIGDLHVVGLASGLEVDMLIAAGLVRRVSTPTVSAEALCPIAPAFRAAAQNGEIEVWECDEGMVYAALQATAQGVSYTPWPAGMGASFAEINDGMEEIDSPFGGGRVIAIRAIKLDFAFAHVGRADVYGNVQPAGSGLGDRALARAAKRVFYSADRIVGNHEIRRNPGATAIAGVDGIVHAPFGAHPFASPGRYIHDEPFMRSWVEACSSWTTSGDRTALDRFFENWISGPADHLDYLGRVGPETLFGLEEGLNFPDGAEA
jgi:glutaconate CoA-transferase subunit A